MVVDFKYSDAYSRANVVAYKSQDGSIYVGAAIYPFDSRDSVFRRCSRYLPGRGREAAQDFQALVAGDLDLLEKFDAYAIPVDADMLVLCGVNLALSKTDLHLALEEEAVLLDRDFADAFDFEEE